jgi:tight adherence protein B
MDLGSIAVAVLCMVSMVLLAYGVARFVGGSGDDITQRLDRFATRAGAASDMPEPKDPNARGKITEHLDKELVRRGRGTDMTQELARADLKLTPAEFLMIKLVVVGILAIAGYLIFHQLFMALPAGIAGYFAPNFYVRFRQGRRKAAFGNQLPDAVSLLANSLRSGYSLPQSMELLSREMQPPIASEFGRVVREMGLGLSFETAMNNMVRRNKNEDLDLVITAILVNHEVGGNLSQVLEVIGHTIRERIRIKGEISVLTAQQRASGYLVGSMPFALTVILFILNPEYMGELFHSLCGYMMACTSFGLVVMAFILIRKIVNIEV